MSNPLLSIREVSVDYVTAGGDARAVNRISLDIHPGETVGLAGESGCGKSTLAFAITRMHNAPALVTEGQILFDGRDVLAMREPELRAFRWNETAMVFQSAMNALNPVITIGEQLTDVILAHRDVSHDEAYARGEVLLERSPWVARTRAALRELPEAFWVQRVDAFRARMDHVLTDLTSAVFSGEELFYHLSLAAFLSVLCTLLFAINRRFEPAGRLLKEQMQQLPILPEEFNTRLEYLLGADSAITDKRKREIAELVTWSVLRLG